MASKSSVCVGQVTVSDQDLNTTSNSLMKFCKSLVRQSQFKSHRIIICGSRMENPTHLATAQLLGIDIEKLDTDSMAYALSVCALSPLRVIDAKYTGEIVRIYTDGTHPGYVKLIKESDNTELLWSECIYNPCVIADGDPKHGPEVLESLKLHKFDTDYRLSNPTANAAGIKGLVITPQDLVFAVHSPYWPNEATEWITRKRYHGFPSKSVIKQIVSYGCDFVQVSHKFGDVNEWRFSFSKGEILLSKSWTMSQRIVYTVLWLINKKIEDSHMCTYYFKTIMLWACEEKPSGYLRHHISNSLRELLIYVMTCLKLKYCPNYFIPANNMMDHFIDTDLDYDIAALFNALKNYNEIFSAVMISRIVLMSAQTKCYKLPAWIKRAVIIYDRINHEEDNFTDLYSSTFETSVWNALQIELSDIHKGLHCQKVAVHCDFMSEMQFHNFEMSEIFLKRAINQWESDERDTWENCNHIIVRFIFNTFLFSETNEEQFTKKKSDRCNDSITSKSTIISSLNPNQKPSAYFRSVETWRYPFYVKHVSGFYSEWPGVSPTVNISWFIAKAYLANLYYTTNRDVSLVMKTCDDIIDVYKQTYKNERFAERTFPVILSTQWASIYDKEIQELIGFYSLCKYIWTQSNSRSVYLGVCPVLFAHYLKARVANVSNITNICECFSHEWKCKCNQQVNNGIELLLHCALHDYPDQRKAFFTVYYPHHYQRRQPLQDVNFHSK